MKGILVDENGDLMIRNRTLEVGDCDADVAERLLKAWKGEFKEAPMLGGNADMLRNGSVNPFWKADVIRQLESQHVSVEKLNIMENGIELIIKN